MATSSGQNNNDFASRSLALGSQLLLLQLPLLLLLGAVELGLVRFSEARESGDSKTENRQLLLSFNAHDENCINFQPEAGGK